VTSLGRTHPSVTYKTASHLQQAFKDAKKNANEMATIRPHRESIDNLRQNLRDANVNREYLSHFPPTEQPTRTSPVFQSKETQTDITMGVDSRSRDTQTDVTMMAMPTQPAGKALANTKDGATTGHIAKRAGRRCRTCGKVIKDWNNFHIVPLGPTIPGERGSIRYLNLKHRAHEHCTVPPNQREPRFPLAPGAKFPKKRKKG